MHTIVKNIQQNKTILMVKQGKPKALSRQRAIYNGEKDVHEFFGVHKNILAYLRYTVHNICQAPVHD